MENVTSIKKKVDELVGYIGSGLPYGADNYEVTSQVAAGPAVIEYRLGATVLKTRTITYTNSGASSTDTLVSSTDT